MSKKDAELIKLQERLRIKEREIIYLKKTISLYRQREIKHRQRRIKPPAEIKTSSQREILIHNSKKKHGYKIYSSSKVSHGQKVQLVMDVEFKSGRIISRQRGYSHLYNYRESNKKMMLKDAFYSAMFQCPFSPRSSKILGMHYLRYYRK